MEASLPYPMGSIIAYSVLQHQLWMSTSHSARSWRTSFGSGFLFVIGLGLLLAICVFFPTVFTRSSFWSAFMVLVTSGILASIYFPRLFGKAADSLEQRILGDRFEYYDQIRSFIAAMPLYNDPTALLEDLENLLMKIVSVRSYQIIVLDETKQVFSLYRSCPEMPDQQSSELSGNAAIFPLHRSRPNRRNISR